MKQLNETFCCCFSKAWLQYSGVVFAGLFFGDCEVVIMGSGLSKLEKLICHLY